MVTREQIRLRLRGYSFGGMPRRPLFFKPTESVCVCVRSWGWQLFCNLHAGCPAHFLNWFRVGCLHHQRVECESVVPPPGGAPPAQGNTRLCSYPSVFPPSVWVSPGWAEMDDTKYHEWMDHRLQYPSDGSNFEISSDVLQQHIVHLRVAGTGACGMTTAWYLLGMVCRFLYLSSPLIINDTFYRETVPG